MYATERVSNGYSNSRIEAEERARYGLQAHDVILEHFAEEARSIFYRFKHSERFMATSRDGYTHGSIDCRWSINDPAI